MNWELYLHNFREWLVSRSTHPPYFLLFVGLFISFTSGTALIAILKQLGYWFEKYSPSQISPFQRLNLLLPFLGMFSGFCLFLGSSLQVFGLSAPLSWLLALLLTVLAGSRVWWKLGRIFGQAALQSYLDQNAIGSFK